MVAVATILMELPSKRSLSTFVLVLVIRASAFFKTFREISLPGKYSTEAKGSNTPCKKGILSSATICNRFFLAIICHNNF